MRRMKYHPHGSVVFVTFRVEEGLLLLSNPLCQTIIKSCLAASLDVHPQIKISHAIAEGTHLHLIVVVVNPDDLPGFIKCFKTESAHAFNKVLGRPKRTVWCEGYDSPVILTPLRAGIALAYLYANPAKDNLSPSIEEYPGFSTWKMYQTKMHMKSWRRIRRYQYRALAPDSHNLRGYTKEAQRLLEGSKEEYPFTIHPNAWLEAFGITDPDLQEECNRRLEKRVRVLEARAARLREREKRRVYGRERLLAQQIDRHYRIKNYRGRRMWCLTEAHRVRIAFITFFKALMEKAREVQRRWRVGDYSLAYPLGLYPPCKPKLQEPLALVTLSW
jgi:hypothetical protein